ncbi:uncharacterized protein LOC135937513 [Cloeon dipterum]|uniref:uncharacterized protein LOC135937513 n=1 Tax=Cloeon dipterum TaxID=197152 RepID=UPI00321FE160
MPQKDLVEGGYVSINGSDYYIELFGRSRADATFNCELKNMTLVSFYDTSEWQNIREWLVFNGYEFYWFWTSAIRHKNSITWIWESNGELVTGFYWGFGQPDIPQGESETYMYFRPWSGGWDDGDSPNLSLSSICEYE